MQHSSSLTALSPRIKRKPVPSLDLRYPPPDPADPFAPLWVLRSRPSNSVISSLDSNNTGTLRQNRKKPSYDLYPTIFNSGGASSQVLVDEPTSYQDHRRRRSQSSPPVSPARLYPGTKDDDTSSSDLDSDTHWHRHHHHKQQRQQHATTIPAQLAKLVSSKPSERNFVDLQTQRHSVVHNLNKSYASVSSLSSSFVHVSHEGENNPDHVGVKALNLATPATTTTAASRKPIAIPSSLSAPMPISNLTSFRSQQDKHRRTLSVTAQPSLHHPSRYRSTTPGPEPRSSTTPARAPPNANIAPSTPDAEWSLLTPARLAQAAHLPVVAPSGLRVPFASLFADHRTIVLFIRHFWCPLCQDYLTSFADILGGHRALIADSVDLDEKAASTTGEQQRQQPEAVDLVVISNGSPAYLPKYKQLFNLSCKMYTDPSLAIYEALGMGRVTTTSSAPTTTATASISAPLPAPATLCGVNHSCTVDAPSKEKQHLTPPKKGQQNGGARNIRGDGTYVRHGLVSGIAMVVMRALKMGMPVWERGGDVHQLGGEFVLGPGLKCTYAHRMQSTKGHAPVRDVLAAAGVRVLPSARRSSLLFPHSNSFSSPFPRVRSDNHHKVAPSFASPLRRPLVASPTTTTTRTTTTSPVSSPTKKNQHEEDSGSNQKNRSNASSAANPPLGASPPSLASSPSPRGRPSQLQRRTNSVYSVTTPIATTGGTASGLRTISNNAVVVKESGLATTKTMTAATARLAAAAEAEAGPGPARRFSVDGANLWVHYPARTASTMAAIGGEEERKPVAAVVATNTKPGSRGRDRGRGGSAYAFSDSESPSPSSSSSSPPLTLSSRKRGGGGGGAGMSSVSDGETTTTATTAMWKREQRERGRVLNPERFKERRFEQQQQQHRLGATGVNASTGTATKPYVSGSVRSLDNSLIDNRGKDAVTAVRQVVSDHGHYPSSSTATTTTVTGKSQKGLGVDLGEVMVIGFENGTTTVNSSVVIGSDTADCGESEHSRTGATEDCC